MRLSGNLKHIFKNRTLTDINIYFLKTFPRLLTRSVTTRGPLVEKQRWCLWQNLWNFFSTFVGEWKIESCKLNYKILFKYRDFLRALCATSRFNPEFLEIVPTKSERYWIVSDKGHATGRAKDLNKLNKMRIIAVFRPGGLIRGWSAPLLTDGPTRSLVTNIRKASGLHPVNSVILITRQLRLLLTADSLFGE